MEEEARVILGSALAASAPLQNLAEAIQQRLTPFGGITLELPRRAAIRRTIF